jgi:hypothetical protein
MEDADFVNLLLVALLSAVVALAVVWWIRRRDRDDVDESGRPGGPR